MDCYHCGLPAIEKPDTPGNIKCPVCGKTVELKQCRRCGKIETTDNITLRGNCFECYFKRLEEMIEAEEVMV